MKDYSDLEDFIEQMQREIYEKDKRDFSEHALYLADNPYKYGRLDTKDPHVYSAMYRGSCGDAITLYLKIVDDKILDVRYEVDGCIVSNIAGSQLCILIDGKTIEYCKRLTPKNILEALGKIPPENYHCADLAIGTLKKTLENYYKENKI